MRKSFALGFRAAKRFTTSSLYTTPPGLEYMGTHQIALMVSSSATSFSTMSISGPSSFMGTFTSSMPRNWLTAKWRS